MGKILLLKATVLSRLNNDEDCEAAFKKAITFNAGKHLTQHFVQIKTIVYDFYYNYSKFTC